ncbi:CapA family protein [Paenibacillus turpanensis]|uniref:CapA family protein n=1 Tax=Paenibacillus turpanensis TaxID=2689078 RepID=UPI00140AAE69|nr:CapA family protein [Paenibacillus turpanensis]
MKSPETVSERSRETGTAKEAEESGERNSGSDGVSELPDHGDRVRLAFVGDMMFADKAGEMLEQHGYDYPYIHVGRLLKDADITAGNLETPITEIGEPAEKKQYSYRSSPKAIPPLADSGMDVLNLANNHAMDYGTAGLLDTIKRLRKAGLHTVGAGKNADEAYRAAILEANGIKVAYVGFSRVIPKIDFYATKTRAGMAETYSKDKAVSAIKQAGKLADLVIVIVHWGEERKETPVVYQRELARAYIDAGADLVVGSHPHVLQGFEVYKGKWIAYSLGNFIFTINPNKLTWNSGILQADCGKSGGCSLSFVPAITKLAQPVLLEGEEKQALYRKLTGLSINAELDKEGRIRERKQQASKD